MGFYIFATVFVFCKMNIFLLPSLLNRILLVSHLILGWWVGGLVGWWLVDLIKPIVHSGMFHLFVGFMLTNLIYPIPIFFFTLFSLTLIAKFSLKNYYNMAEDDILWTPMKIWHSNKNNWIHNILSSTIRLYMIVVWVENFM